MTKKDKNILKKAEAMGAPVFIFIATDSQAVESMEDYRLMCMCAGSPQAHLDGIVERVKEFITWQKKNANMVKTPD